MVIADALRLVISEWDALTLCVKYGGKSDGFIATAIIEIMKEKEIQNTATTICLNSKVDGKQPSVADRIYDPDGISVAVTSGWVQNTVEPKIEQIGILSMTLLSDGFKNPQRGRVYSTEGLSPAMNCVNGGGQEPKILQIKTATKQGYAPSYRIRKLTPRECFRLMGVREHNIDKIQNASISNSQQYKLAGNSIVVDNLFHILRKLLIETNTQEQLSLF